LDPASGRSSKLGDFLAIAAGWVVLGAVIFYPGLQLVAIVICLLSTAATAGNRINQLRLNARI
jgi:hypothetical protein